VNALHHQMIFRNTETQRYTCKPRSSLNMLSIVTNQKS